MPDFNDANWKTINVPHDWRIHDKYNINNRRLSAYLPKGIGWYRKQLNIKPKYKGKRIYISFDGVFRNSTIWVNGKKAGSHLSGYTGFVLDITDLVNFRSNKNVLAVLVDNVDRNKYADSLSPGEHRPGHEGWWYEGYGIYRHVNLIITNPVHVSTWGTFVYTKNDSHKSADVIIKTNITNNTDKAYDLVIKTSLFDPDGKRVRVASSKKEISERSQTEIQKKTTVFNPKLWSPNHPNLYSVVTKVISDGKLSDIYKTPLGIRYFRFTPDSGFFLNGKHFN
jgi:beta-galactosidase